MIKLKNALRKAGDRYGLLYWNGSQFTDEEMKKYLQGEEDVN